MVQCAEEAWPFGAEALFESAQQVIDVADLRAQVNNSSHNRSRFERGSSNAEGVAATSRPTTGMVNNPFSKRKNPLFPSSCPGHLSKHLTPQYALFFFLQTFLILLLNLTMLQAPLLLPQLLSLCL
ncbi:hypothetical protein J1N35_005408 [Gossypium stocksii]|uniref:Uncharacterized protein n=1 Tax=Gossypium stocksii TaxID=47602 RepID=A0A9D3WEG9_9ROSI|nr:hypothetical protein J1N35_005408 [Gossypium stocksii]